jgi:uncharacterized heparinase superfamily protein
LLEKGARLLKRELVRQILVDGAHIELTPSYQKILIIRLLDCIVATMNSPLAHEHLPLLKSSVTKMLDWLISITFSNGEVPAVNDSTNSSVPTTAALIRYAKRLNISTTQHQLSDSGYRIRKKERYEIFMDFGSIAAHYQPAHSHADIFNFLLNISKRPVIVDPGISTYENNSIRHRERSTPHHNTVSIDFKNQLDVWASFRVGKRASVLDMVEQEDQISAKHDGFRKMYGVYHNRKFLFFDGEILIEDWFDSADQKGELCLHFHPSESVNIFDKQIQGSDFIVNFDSAHFVSKEVYQFALDFNRVKDSLKIVVGFRGTLRTQIKLK